MKPLTLTPIEGLPLIEQGDDLAAIIHSALSANEIELQDDDILVVAQKIVSKAEGRRYDLNSVKPSPEAIELALTTEKDARLVQLILDESKAILRAEPGLLIVEHKLGFICANAGIDRSNVSRGNDQVLLLPDNPDLSASLLRESIDARSEKKIAVLIIDSHGRAWRNGTLGLAIGLSGLPGLVDFRGENDLFDRPLKITMVGAADELAAGASLMMGQAGESMPLIHVRGFPHKLREGSLSELLRPKDNDLFR